MTCIGKQNLQAKEVYGNLSPLQCGNGQHLEAPSWNFILE